ncbi:hypothetical protein GUJ93_ZPchr0011g27689 [Zizania palustris]|uniref:Uncharacterized protein n=1 Tax=Zizania palustris TaxID=103762 RepID=A0A8J5WF29_ZIZPA|nr:hypothetical protein GUJ93_ZPchr0011g27689 [Zizania palustris]
MVQNQINEIQGKLNSSATELATKTTDNSEKIQKLLNQVFQALEEMYYNSWLHREPPKLVDGGQSQRTFVYIKDAIEVVVLMIV